MWEIALIICIQCPVLPQFLEGAWVPDKPITKYVQIARAACEEHITQHSMSLAVYHCTWRPK